MIDSRAFPIPVRVGMSKTFRLLQSEGTHELMAVARMTALIGSPSLIASDNRLMYKAAIPSPLPKPSADSSKVWQVDDGDKTPRLSLPSCFSTLVTRLDPPTTAAVQSPASKLWHAR